MHVDDVAYEKFWRIISAADLSGDAERIERLKECDLTAMNINHWGHWPLPPIAADMG